MNYIKGLRDSDGQTPPREPIDFGPLYPDCSTEGIDLLTRLLNLNPYKRITADEGLEHPYVAQMRDPTEEIVCPKLFDFASFECIQEEDALLECIVQEVIASKGNDARSDSARKIRDNAAREAGPRQAHIWEHKQKSQDEYREEPSRSRYSGTTISSPRSASAAEARLYAMVAVQKDRGIELEEGTNTHGMISDDFVGETEDMDEDNITSTDSHASICVEYRRQLVGPTGTDYQALERHLSRE
ncbi:hypothetical protein BX666DRAFT_1875245 [Dichotomocladium elegans]|nr:hypothetical protein BX666DRAFT_1875245 [Dichotomocladium elegans]